MTKAKTHKHAAEYELGALDEVTSAVLCLSCLLPLVSKVEELTFTDL